MNGKTIIKVLLVAFIIGALAWTNMRKKKK